MEKQFYEKAGSCLTEQIISSLRNNDGVDKNEADTTIYVTIKLLVPQENDSQSEYVNPSWIQHGSLEWQK